MNNRILVAYASHAGSTAEVAEAVGQALRQDGTSVEVRPIRETRDVSAYDAVVVGGPMIMGWHRDAVQFVAAHQGALSQKPVAYFLTALSLTAAPSNSLYGIPIYQDPALAKPPQRPGKLSWKENYSTVFHCLTPALNNAPAVKPVSVGFFAGKLDLGKLDLFSRLFVQFVIGAKPGDYRNFAGIGAWATDLAGTLARWRSRPAVPGATAAINRRIGDLGLSSSGNLMKTISQTNLSIEDRGLRSPL